MPPDATPSSGASNGDRSGLVRRWKPEQRRLLVFWLVYFVAWHAIRFGALLLGTPSTQTSLWHPLVGLLFFVLLTFGWRAFVSALLTDWSLGGLLWLTAPAPVSLASLLIDHFVASLIAVVAYLLAASALRAWNIGRVNNNFANLTYAWRFLGAALLGSGLAMAGSNAARLLYAGFLAADPGLQVWLHGLIGDFIGIVTVTPLLLVHLHPRLRDWLQKGVWRQPFPSASRERRWFWPACFVGLLLVLASLLEAPPWLDLGAPARPFLTLFVLLPLAWIAITGGLSAVTVAICVLNVGLTVLVGWRGWQEAALYYQLAMLAVALTGLLLGGAIEARDWARAQFRDLSRIADDLLWEVNTDGLVTRLTGSLVWNLTPRTGPWWTNVHAIPGDHREILGGALRTRRPFREVLLSVRDDADEVRWLRVNGVPFRDELGRFAGYRGTATDVTTEYRARQVLADYADQLQREVAAQTAELQRINRDLAFNEQRYRTMLAAAPVGMAEVDAEGRCQYVNFPWCFLTGRAATAVLGHSWLDCVCPDQQAAMERQWQTTAGLRTSDGEFQSLAGRWLSVHWSTLCDQDGATVVGAIVILNDITDRRSRERENWELAHFDALTRLPNRNLFWDRLEQALRLASRGQRTVAVLWLDLDGFKAVNDTLGHAAGGELLCQVGQRLQTTLRESDTAARLGGDEFAVVLTTIAQPRDATNVAQKIITRIGQSFALSQGPARISTSIGIALYPDHASSAKDLAHCADLAMYAAKQAGKSGWRLWDGVAVMDHASS